VGVTRVPGQVLHIRMGIRKCIREVGGAMPMRCRYGLHERIETTSRDKGYTTKWVIAPDTACSLGDGSLCICRCEW